MRQYTLDVERPTPSRPGFLADLNEGQRQVAGAAGGPMLVIAGAGSGKTRTLVYRAAHLIGSGAAPDRILLVTFTNRAAQEMTERVSRLVPVAADRIWAGTFHAIGRRILRRYAERLGYGTNFGIINRQEQRDLMTATLGRVRPGPISGPRFPKPEVLVSMLSSTLNTDRPLAAVIEGDHTRFASLTSEIDEVLTAYLGLKVEMNLMDFDDLLVNWRLLLEDHPDVRARFQQHFQHLLIDEYQDINRLQAVLIRQMTGPHGNVMAVGDDCQSIYGFRGADVANILAFPDLYPGARVHRLETNYRSTPEILALANRSIAHNRRRFDKTLRAVRSSGERPAFLALADGEQQARFVAQRLLELRDEGTDLHRMAVLYRAHFHAMELQLELQRRGVPFSVRGGLRFFEQAHIRDLLAHLRLLYNPLDQLAWMRVLKLQPGIGNARAVRLCAELVAGGDPWESLRQDTVGHDLPGPGRGAFARLREVLLALGGPELIGSPGAMFDFLLEGGYEAHLRDTYPNAEQRVEDIRQLGLFAGQFDHYQDFLEELALVEHLSAQDVKGGGEPDERVILSTVHQAKGLEWEVVFVIGLADGRFPIGRALRSEEEIEEERRLFYVAVTRARTGLYLCFPQWGVAHDRAHVLQRPSRFLTELPITDDGLVETWQVQ